MILCPRISALPLLGRAWRVQGWRACGRELTPRRCMDDIKRGAPCTGGVLRVARCGALVLVPVPVLLAGAASWCWCWCCLLVLVLLLAGAALVVVVVVVISLDLRKYM